MTLAQYPDIDLDKIVLVRIRDGKISFDSTLNTDADEPIQLVEYSWNETAIDHFVQKVNYFGFWEAFEKIVFGLKQFLTDNLGREDALHFMWYDELPVITPDRLARFISDGYYIIRTED